MEGFEGVSCGHVHKQAVVSITGYKLGEWMGPACSSDSDLPGCTILFVDGDHSRVELVEVGEPCALRSSCKTTGSSFCVKL